MRSRRLGFPVSLPDTTPLPHPSLNPHLRSPKTLLFNHPSFPPLRWAVSSRWGWACTALILALNLRYVLCLCCLAVAWRLVSIYAAVMQHMSRNMHADRCRYRIGVPRSTSSGYTRRLRTLPPTFRHCPQTGNVRPPRCHRRWVLHNRSRSPYRMIAGRQGLMIINR